MPTTFCPLNYQELEDLKQAVDPTASCDDYGVAWYAAAREFIKETIQATHHSQLHAP